MYLSLAEINSANNFDIYLLPHIEHLKRMIDTFGIKFDSEKMISFDYGGNFCPSIKKEIRKKKRTCWFRSRKEKNKWQN